MGQGLIGYSAEQNKVLNVRNVANDPKYERDIDLKGQTSTKNLICVPIRNRLGFVDGIIQAVNKQPLSDGTMRVFSKVDEGMIQMVGRMVGLFFKSSVGSDNNARFVHSLG